MKMATVATGGRAAGLRPPPAARGLERPCPWPSSEDRPQHSTLAGRADSTAQPGCRGHFQDRAVTTRSQRQAEGPGVGAGRPLQACG